MAEKKLYSGTFNWAGESYALHTRATNADRAFLNFMHKLSEKVEHNYYAVLSRFTNHTHNYEIREISDES